MPVQRPGSAALHAVVSGRVQGVGFRYSAARQARALGITGTVANLPDGSVEVLAEGPLPDLERLLEWLRDGPPGAHVYGVDAQWLVWTGRFRGFEVAF